MLISFPAFSGHQLFIISLWVHVPFSSHPRCLRKSNRKYPPLYSEFNKATHSTGKDIFLELPILASTKPNKCWGTCNSPLLTEGSINTPSLSPQQILNSRTRRDKLAPSVTNLTCKPVNTYDASLQVILLYVQAQDMYINKGDDGCAALHLLQLKGRVQECPLDFSAIFESAQKKLNFAMWVSFHLRNTALKFFLAGLL